MFPGLDGICSDIANANRLKAKTPEFHNDATKR
jgi:hypothetical protein